MNLRILHAIHPFAMNQTKWLWVWIACIAILVTPNDVGAEEAAGKIEFNRDIRPILSDKCFACHGTDPKHRQAELRLDTAEGSYQIGNESHAIVPGEPENSLLMDRILSDDPDLRMPPANSHKELAAEEVEILRAWILQGAEYQKHWAFEPIRAITPPSLSDATNIRNPIDAFIQARLSAQELLPAIEADKSTLIRRVAFALTGLPPTLQEQELYFSDNAADAYEAMVDRYMQSDRFGEEMARHWLDVARYADTHGMHLDNERQTWAYRDWVVSAFNRNLPFDQFTVDQLAGDLLPDPTQDQLVATGFNRCNVTSSEGGSIDAELIYRYAVDRTSTTMQTWLGLTGGCAVCHDHKFDPISQKEFYSMYAFFNSAADPAMDGNALLTQPVMRLEGAEDKAKLAQFDERVATVLAQRDQLALEIPYTDPASMEPRPVPSNSQSIWMDDEFPTGGQLVAAGAPLQFVDSTDALPAASGSKILKRTDAGLAQDVWESSTAPLSLPGQGKIFADVWLDPANLPKSIMLQFNRGGWNHRAVWGDYDAIDWGAVNTHQRVSMGPMPEAGKWVTLEVPLETVGLAEGDQLVGFALTQFGGTVYWDKVGVSGTLDIAADPRHSFDAWLQQVKGQDVAQYPEGIREALALWSQTSSANETGSTVSLNADALAKLKSHFLTMVCVDTRPQFAALEKQAEDIRAEKKQFSEAMPSTFIYRDLATPRESFVMMRGAYDKPSDKVTPGVLAVLPPMKLVEAERVPSRLDLARWLVDPDQPLTARVTVNRFWQQFFGVGLVKTSYDFGSQGEMPSHPELLDWLSLHYQQTGWDTKQLVRMFVTSHTFRQSSRIEASLREMDPENRLYARGPRFRLDAEPIRDNALFVGGLMDLEMGGKGVKPYQPSNIWEPVGFAGSNTRFYQQDSGNALYRRSLYTFYKRTAPPPFMANFDAPNREQFCTRRERSNTPLQALQLMNDVQHVEAARGLAQRLISDGTDLSTRIRLAYRMVLSREPAAYELTVLERQYKIQLARFTSDPESAARFIKLGQSVAKDNIDPVELASMTMVASTLLNLDETVTRN